MVEPTRRLEDKATAVLRTHFGATLGASEAARHTDVMDTGAAIAKVIEIIAVGVFDAFDIPALGVDLITRNTLFEFTALEIFTVEQRHWGRAHVDLGFGYAAIGLGVGNTDAILITEFALWAWRLVIAFDHGLGGRPASAGVVTQLSLGTAHLFPALPKLSDTDAIVGADLPSGARSIDGAFRHDRTAPISGAVLALSTRPLLTARVGIVHIGQSKALVDLDHGIVDGRVYGLVLAGYERRHAQ